MLRGDAMTEPTTAQAQPRHEDRTRRQWWRVPAAVTVTFVILWRAASLASGGLVLWGFGGILGLAVIVGTLVGAAALLGAVGVVLTGKPRIGASVLAVGAVAVMLAAGPRTSARSRCCGGRREASTWSIR
ncbi:hypothetical protein GCM10025876_14340 [Demequina litorisediminis]|uniref:Uncharacterized protein n=2 Tax=Demequina litorisediminis TaxID=1849022 RepID=A0ABQ6IBS0_9MICO|nr:hypothetical protein GCM10025876_14340 [Demequina litorisediminis]